MNEERGAQLVHAFHKWLASQNGHFTENPRTRNYNNNKNNNNLNK